MELATLIVWIGAAVVAGAFALGGTALALAFAAGTALLAAVALPLAFIAPVVLALMFVVWLVRENGRAQVAIRNRQFAVQTGIAVGRPGEF